MVEKPVATDRAGVDGQVVDALKRRSDVERSTFVARLLDHVATQPHALNDAHAPTASSQPDISLPDKILPDFHA